MQRTKLINVSKAMKDLKKLLTKTHDVKQVLDSYDYKGIDIRHYKVLATDFNIKKSMTKENLDWNREQHGISMLDTILLKIFQLGYEQAVIQHELKESERTELMLKAFERANERAVEKAVEQKMADINFYRKYATFPTAEIKRGNKVLIQQRETKEGLLSHLKLKYPDWEITKINC